MKGEGSKVAEWKRGTVERLLGLMSEFPVVGILDITEVPARQFQQIRQRIGEDTRIMVAKNTLIARALDAAAESKPGIGELKKFLTGQSAIIFSRKNPFKLNKFLRENRVNAPARVGSISSRDVVIPAGETDLPPGPVVAELQRVGLKARIQAGKVVILEEAKLLKAGDVITKEVSDTLAKFGILPVELGLRMKAAYEGGIVFSENLLDFDENRAIEQIRIAWTNAFNLALNVEYPTGETVTLLLAEAHSRAFRLALNRHLPVRDIMPIVLSEAHAHMISLARALGSVKRECLDQELIRMLGLPTEEIKKDDVDERKQEVKGEGV